MQIRIYAKTAKAAARKFKRKYPNQDIYDITREVPLNTKPIDRFYRVTNVKKGTFPKSKLSNYNKT